VVKGHGLGGVPARDDDVEQSVVIKVLHDGTAGLVEAVDTGQVADVAEPADVKHRGQEAVQRDQKPRFHLARVFPHGHVGHVQQPADLEIVGELAQVFGEMLDC
jgi:hypothetical protein